MCLARQKNSITSRIETMAPKKRPAAATLGAMKRPACENTEEINVDEVLSCAGSLNDRIKTVKDLQISFQEKVALLNKNFSHEDWKGIHHPWRRTSRKRKMLGSTMQFARRRQHGFWTLRWARHTRTYVCTSHRFCKNTQGPNQKEINKM